MNTNQIDLSEQNSYPMHLISKYTAILAMAGHMVFLISFLILDIWPLFYFNIASVLVFAATFFLNNKKYHKLILIITLIEIISHAYFATFYLGWPSGFHIYILCLLPLLFFYRNIGKWLRIIIICFLFFTYIILKYLSLYWPETSMLSQIEQYYFEMVNIIISFFVFLILSATYSLATLQLEKKLLEKNAKLEEYSRKDPLTGLSNRRDILDKIEIEKKRMKRNSKSCCFILADIDDFKKVNDNYGHDYGDYVIKSISAILVENLREQDYVCRWGGEEFLILLPETNYSGGIIISEKLCRTVRERHFEFNAIQTKISITMGLANFDIQQTIDESIKTADIMLYKGKSKGKDRVEY